MAPAICPNGHTSDSADYCDTCGSPIGSGSAATGGASSAAPAATPAEAKPIGVVCPNCAVMNAPGALFCEACGYDYTTGTMPRPPEPSILDLDTPLPDPAPAADQAPTAPDGAPVVEVADRASPGEAAQHGARPGPAAARSMGPSGSMLDLDAPVPPIPAPSPSPQSTPAPPRPNPDTMSGSPGVAASAQEAESDSFDWVLEVWVDPEWYALQESPDPMPSAGLPDIMPLRKRTLLIGRPSRSRNIHPDIDCEPDTGISRRQAQLSTDGTRWFIEDLDSANGTFVAEAAGGMPTTPIQSGRRRELSGDERIYLGAWTRLVLRRATPEEQEAYATA